MLDFFSIKLMPAEIKKALDFFLMSPILYLFCWASAGVVHCILKTQL